MAGEFVAGLVEGELPVNGRTPGVTLGHTGLYVRTQLVLRGDALVAALSSDGREFEFDHVEPGGVFGRIVNLEAG